MKRFRVMAWLATLVVLAGCVQSNVEESISEAADGLVVEQSCGFSPSDLKNYTKYDTRLFSMETTGIGAFEVISDLDSPIIVLSYSTFFRDRPPCSFTLTPQLQGIIPSDQFNIFALPQKDRDFLPNESKIVRSKVRECQQFEGLNNRTYRDETIRVDTFLGGVIDTSQFVGCDTLVQNNTIGFVATYGNLSFRITMIVDTLISTRMNE